MKVVCMLGDAVSCTISAPRPTATPGPTPEPTAEPTAEPTMAPVPTPGNFGIIIPDDVTKIEDEAFMGVDAEQIVIPDGCVKIGSRAFADCRNLKVIVIPETTVSIAFDALEGCPDVVIYGVVGSRAEVYARVVGIPFIAQ